MKFAIFDLFCFCLAEKLVFFLGNHGNVGIFLVVDDELLSLGIKFVLFCWVHCVAHACFFAA